MNTSPLMTMIASIIESICYSHDIVITGDFDNVMHAAYVFKIEGADELLATLMKYSVIRETSTSPSVDKLTKVVGAIYGAVRAGKEYGHRIKQ